MAVVFCDEGLTWLAQHMHGDTTNGKPPLNGNLYTAISPSLSATSVRANLTKMAGLSYASVTLTGATWGVNVDTTNHVAVCSYILRYQFAAGVVSGATNASPIVITTSAAHGRVTGDTVVIDSVGGNTAANGTWVVTFISSTTFSLNGSTGNGAYTSGGRWGTPVIGWYLSDNLDTKIMIAETLPNSITVGTSKLNIAITVNLTLKLCS